MLRKRKDNNNSLMNKLKPKQQLRLKSKHSKRQNRFMKKKRRHLWKRRR